MSSQFAQLLKNYRISRGLSQRSLANLAGINTSYISRLERDERGVASREMIIRLGKLLSLSTDQMDEWLLSGGYASDRLMSLPFGELAKLLDAFDENDKL